jgi:hypothetical protein
MPTPDIRVLNIKHYAWNDSPLTIYVGRAAYRFQASPLANPFPIVNGRDREQCITLYRRWLWIEIRKQSYAYRELYRLKSLAASEGYLNLCCWCAPCACHADVIKSAILWMINPGAKKNDGEATAFLSSDPQTQRLLDHTL